MGLLFSWEGVRTAFEVLRHSQTAIALVTGAGVSAVTWYLTRRSYLSGTFPTRVEVVGFEPELQSDGTYIVDFPTHGDQMNLSELIGMPRLEKKIIAAAKHADTRFVVLEDAYSHRMMMGILEDHVTGNDPRTNAEALDGVPTRRVEVFFSPMYFYEESEGLWMLRVCVIAQKFARMLVNGEASKFRPRLPRKGDLLEVFQDLATHVDDDEQASGDTAFIWPTTLKASLGAIAASREGYQSRTAA